MSLLPWIFITITIIGADRLSKILIISTINTTDSIQVIKGFFSIIRVENSGAAWSMFQNGRFIFIALTIIALIFIYYFMVKTHDKFLRLSLSVIAGGAIGNLIDRIAKGSVIDFFNFNFGSYNFPTFNIADMSIVIGTVLLAYYMLFLHDKRRNQLPEEPSIGDRI